MRQPNPHLPNPLTQILPSQSRLVNHFISLCQIWTKLGEAERRGNSITPIVSPPNSNPDLSTMFLMPLHFVWSRATEPVIQPKSCAHSSFFLESHWQGREGIKCFGMAWWWCGRQKKCCVWLLRLWQRLILLTAKVQRFFENLRYFSKLKHRAQRNKKVECFWTREGAVWSAFIETAASAPHTLCC